MLYLYGLQYIWKLKREIKGTLENTLVKAGTERRHALLAKPDKSRSERCRQHGGVHSGDEREMDPKGFFKPEAGTNRKGRP
ncbi:MAG: hypothetical protein PHP04_03560 [Bacteroidales bacterium]|nr:hypothetical protein [Bacteroidales bacterium]